MMIDRYDFVPIIFRITKIHTFHIYDFDNIVNHFKVIYP